jgi:diacylglycerol kinase family enzyme
VPGLGVISNPKSRMNRRRPGVVGALDRLIRPLGDGAIARSTADPDAIEAVAREFLERGIDILALNGGDGTNHVTLTEFLKVWGDEPLPKLLLLRGGTMNTVARGMGVVRGRPTTLLLRAVQALQEGREIPSREFDLLRIEAGQGPPQYGFIFGNGLIARFLDAYYGYRDPSPWVGFKVLCRAVGAALTRGPAYDRFFGRMSATVTIDGKPWSRTDWLAVTAATVPEIGLGFAPWHRSGERPGSFHSVGFGCGPLGIVAALPTVRLGLAPSNPKILDVVGSRLELRCETPQGFIVDGDYHPPVKAVNLASGPRVTVLRP